MAPSLPAFAPFPSTSLREHISPDDWAALLSAWTALAQAHLSLPDAEFASSLSKDESLPAFLLSFAAEAAKHSSSVVGAPSPAAAPLKGTIYLLATRIFQSGRRTPPSLLRWEFLSDLSRIYGKKRTADPIASIFSTSRTEIELSLTAQKKWLILNLEMGIKGEIKQLEERLTRVNHLLHASPDACAFFLAGSDFLDGLVSCYKVMNPPLRKAIVATTYLCLIGLTEGKHPNYSMLGDQLFSIKSAAETHRDGPLNANDSLIAELVTVTPILRQIQRRVEGNGSATTALKSRITSLEGFRKPGGTARPRRLARRKLDKGKGRAPDDRGEVEAEMHMHRLSQIAIIQDLFPELGSGFVMKLLDEYGDDTEQVTAHLLDDSLPPHLAGVDHQDQLPAHSVSRNQHHEIAPRTTPPQLPERRNIYDDDELDRLEMDVSQLHFGKREPEKTADDILKDKSTAPNKAAILSALAAFDSDDDERDDTYDVDDVGGTVDKSANEEADGSAEANEEALFKVFQATPAVFGRDAATRRGPLRAKLKEDTGMTDEAIEGWALMLSRNPQQKRRLESKYSAFSGQQLELPSTAWRASPAGSGTEDSDPDGGASMRGGARGGRGRGRGVRGGGGGRGGGNVAGPTGDKDTEMARRRKEANKGSRANHNRREGRARKMARVGFPG